MDNFNVIDLKVSDIDENLDDGIMALSFVHTPAIEEDFVYLSDQKIELKTIDEEKRIVVGLALVPDKKILRKRGDYKYYITFSKDTVRKAAEKYMRTLRIHNTTVDHETKVDGVYLLEAWIIEDANNDKANYYGLNAVEGGFVTMFRVENDDVWSGIKAGKYMGFSIEGLFKNTVENLSDVQFENYMAIIDALDNYEQKK